MSRRVVGIGLIVISVFLYGIRYLSAALLGSSMPNWSQSTFQSLLHTVGYGPSKLSVIALIVGILYLIWAEIDEFIKNKKNNCS